MSFEEETDYSTAHYRCIDPIQNFEIKIVLQSVKNLYIPLPQFDLEQYSSKISSDLGEYQSNAEEFVFKWQEKKFSRTEMQKYLSETDWKKKLSEKYHVSIKDEPNNLSNSSNKVFSYVEADNYSVSENELDLFTQSTNYISSLSRKVHELKISGSDLKNYKNISKRKIINYYPSEEFKNQAHLITKSAEKMFIMVDLGCKIMETNKSKQQEHYERVLCSLTYDFSSSVLQMTPSFSKSKSKPYIIGMPNDNGRNFYFYWIYHASLPIEGDNLTKEIQLMSKVFDYQEEVKKLKIDIEFFIGKPDYIYTTVLGEIISAQDFEYDNLHIHYFMKVPPNWRFSDTDSLFGRTQSCQKNAQGICYFSYLFEMSFCTELNSFEDFSEMPLELFFEVLSIDEFRRYRNEGYAYICIPKNPGMHKYNLRCWRISDGTIFSQLKRFFIGGGPELEDVSCIGLSINEESEVMSRFGVKTIPSGFIEVNLNILHQSENFVAKTGERSEFEKNFSSRLETGSLLGSVNAVLEAFRKARERMLQAKTGLQNNSGFIVPEIQNQKKSE